MNRKNTPIPRRTVHGNMPPMNLNDMLHDSESQPRASELSASGFIHTIKPFEKAGQMFLGNTDTIVFHAYHDLRVD